MKIMKFISLLLFLSIWAVGVNAQGYSRTPRFYYANDWSFGAGFNVVDDSGVLFGDFSENWNFSMPFYVSAEFYVNNQFSFMGMLSTNKYKEGKVYMKGEIVEGDASYFAADLNTKFSFREILQSYVFDPYVFIGFGYTSIGEITTVAKEHPYNVREIPAVGRMTINGGLGFNVWFSRNWGLNFNLAGKWGANGNSDHNNHKQYSLGAIYMLN